MQGISRILYLKNTIAGIFIINIEVKTNNKKMVEIGGAQNDYEGDVNK